MQLVRESFDIYVEANHQIHWSLSSSFDEMKSRWSFYHHFDLGCFLDFSFFTQFTKTTWQSSLNKWNGFSESNRLLMRWPTYNPFENALSWFLRNQFTRKQHIHTPFLESRRAKKIALYLPFSLLEVKSTLLFLCNDCYARFCLLLLVPSVANNVVHLGPVRTVEYCDRQWDRCESCGNWFSTFFIL